MITSTFYARSCDLWIKRVYRRIGFGLRPTNSPVWFSGCRKTYGFFDLEQFEDVMNTALAAV